MVGGLVVLGLDALTPGTEIGLRASVASASVGENALDTTTARAAPQASDTGDFDPSSSARGGSRSIVSRGAPDQLARSSVFEDPSPISPVTPFTNIARHALKNDADYWADIKGYEQFSCFFKNLTRLADPDNIGDFAAHNFVGSPQTVTEQVEKLAAIGFNHIIVHPATVGVPRALRHDVLRRFAKSVAPEFSSAFSKAA